jgi:hypothetical protein
MAWAELPAPGPGGPLAAARTLRSGPPRSYAIDGTTFELRPSWWPMVELLPTGSWHLHLLLDMTHAEDAGELRARLHDRGDAFGLADAHRIATALVERATARPWWVAERLYAWTVHHMNELDGVLLNETGLDIAAMLEYHPARALNVVHSRLVAGADEKARAEFDNSLYRPPITVSPSAAPLWVAEDEGASFMAAMGGATAGGALGRSK